MNAPIKARPMMRGIDTCAEPQGNLMPAKVRPTMASVVPDMTIKFPLNKASQLHGMEMVPEKPVCDLPPIYPSGLLPY